MKNHRKSQRGVLVLPVAYFLVMLWVTTISTIAVTKTLSDKSPAPAKTGMVCFADPNGGAPALMPDLREGDR